MKRIILTFLALLCSQIIALSEEIHFDNNVYTLKYSALAPTTNGYGNEYFLKSENVANWTKMIGVYYYPVENKKTNQAALSFLVNGCENAKKYFEYDIYKFEKNPNKGMTVLKYAVKHYFTNDGEINSIAQNIKENNDKYLEIIITSPIPTIIEKDISRLD